MAAGFNPFKKMWGNVKPGGGGLLGMRKGPQSISSEAARRAKWNPAYTVSREKMMSQPYPDKILRDSTKLGGIKAWDKAKEMAGEAAEFEYLTKELDQDFVSEAMASALGGSPDLPKAPTSGGPSGTQPQPGAFETLIPEPSPGAAQVAAWDKRKKLEQLGLLA